jgi:hypothetical protein
LEKDIIKLCIECFNCKTKKGTTYCKLGAWEEKSNKSILHTPYDFNCPEWEEA